MREIYADNAATTKLSPEVLERMLPYFSEVFGNPSSLYRIGGKAKEALENARDNISKNLGAARPSEIENADGIGEVGNSRCGDIMKMYIKFDDNTISDVKFKTFGCGAAIATSSMATELIKGKSVDEALQLTNKAVMEALDGLPPVKVHCSVLAEEAIKAAVSDYYKKRGIDPEMMIKN